MENRDIHKRDGSASASEYQTSHQRNSHPARKRPAAFQGRSNGWNAAFVALGDRISILQAPYESSVRCLTNRVLHGSIQNTKKEQEVSGCQ